MNLFPIAISDLKFYGIATIVGLVMSFATYYWINNSLTIGNEVLVGWMLLTTVTAILTGKAYLIKHLGGENYGNSI